MTDSQTQRIKAEINDSTHTRPEIEDSFRMQLSMAKYYRDCAPEHHIEPVELTHLVTQIMQGEQIASNFRNYKDSEIREAACSIVDAWIDIQNLTYKKDAQERRSWYIKGMKMPMFWQTCIIIFVAVIINLILNKFLSVVTSANSLAQAIAHIAVIPAILILVADIMDKSGKKFEALAYSLRLLADLTVIIGAVLAVFPTIQ